MMRIQAEAYKNEIFQCGRCNHDFEATVATWVDASRSPGVKTLLQRWEFNIITCPHCASRNFSNSFFFYEDFADGLLVAVFPIIPVNHLSLQEEIRRKYGYYPTLDFFYDMTQLWLLIYLQEHYKKNRNASTVSRIGIGEERLRRFLLFLKKDPLMLAIRETLTATFLGNKTDEDLQSLLWRALAMIEGESPWLRDGAYHAAPTA